jgi:serine/threonine protein kinase
MNQNDGPMRSDTWAGRIDRNSQCPIPEKLWLLLHELLDPGEDSVVSLHVEHCHFCQQHLDRLSGPHSVTADCDRQFGKYRLGAELGRGSSGVVYLAVCSEFPGPVAVKILCVELSGTEEVQRRFLQEAEILKRLRHPGIAAILESGQIDGRLYLTTDYVAGGTLTGITRRQPMDEIAAAKLMVRLSEAMHSCHEHGIVHRDLKPANTLEDLPSGKPDAEKDLLRGQPRIVDFGLARFVQKHWQQSQRMPFWGRWITWHRSSSKMDEWSMRRPIFMHWERSFLSS